MYMRGKRVGGRPEAPVTENKLRETERDKG